MKSNRAELLKALKTVKPGVGDGRVEQSSCFAFQDGRVYSFNDEVAVSYPIKVGFEGAVAAKEFEQFVNKLKGDEIELVLKDGSLFVSKSKAKAGLRLDTINPNLIASIGDTDNLDWIELPEKFSKAVKFCLFTASKDESSLLKCLHIFGQHVESSDNQRITRYDMGKAAKGVFPTDLLITAAAAKDVIACDPVEYAMSEGWIHFQNESGALFSCRFYEDEYPNFDEFLECEGDEITFPADLSEVLDRAGVFSDGQRVNIILEPNLLVVNTENNAGWFEEECEAVYDGEVAEFDIQPEFMNAIIKINNKAVMGNQTMKLQGDSFQHVMWLMIPKAKK